MLRSNILLMMDSTEKVMDSMGMLGRHATRPRLSCNRHDGVYCLSFSGEYNTPESDLPCFFCGSEPSILLLWLRLQDMNKFMQ